MFASFKSIASYIPERVFKNSDFEKIIDTSDEWIVKRTGIKERRFAAEHEATSDLAFEASKIAIQRAGIDAEEIDCILVATISPDFLCMPSTACVLAERLGIENIPAFDISAACSGFIYLLSIAKAYVESNTYKNILIVGAEKLSAITDFSDRSTCVLFGDGAGAAVIGTTQEKSSSVLDISISSNGKYQDFLVTPGGGSRTPIRADNVDKNLQYMKMKGNETFKLAVKTLASDVKDILQRNNISPKDIRFFIPHQANLRIIKAVGELLDFSIEQSVITVDKYGNTSAASIPMAMNDIYEEGRLKKGDLILLDAFGGGLTWGSALLYFNGGNLI